MKKTIRVLHSNDYPHLEVMDTGIEFDYIKHIFDRLVTGNNRLYGLFLDGQLVSLSGYSIYAGSYAMLGRLRSDRRFTGNGYSTELVSYVLNQVFQLNNIHWAGANTQEDNGSARRVLEKIGLSAYTTLHGAITKDISLLESGSEPWWPVTDLQRKQEWINRLYIKSASIFPYECYYPFPGSPDLFQDHDLMQWSFYENESGTRFLITKYDQKKHHYLHAVYPWNDIVSQQGLWETIANDYRRLAQQTDDETYIWMDLTKEEAQSLPLSHQFELPSPWILYGIDKVTFHSTRRSSPAEC
ncbi:Acetyltransferase (GNAT) domain-containing protein [Lentibacillus halodurans]|uniref:Acetyltransferase (GNAT) domain-containing protein n=1 Tax=Lentibacillus halodurans TaxID=237679 RepID=A0A1I0W579_9BACI|nr:GNAT family N-acetyltransferase [Lentibacillus halodurans]SFA83478.1 Acetyltransferase (GNAT) domain-containing protein [Lentibacillus halodurans]